MKRIIVSVTNDLVTDQRVFKVCKTLQELDFDILLVGRKLKDSPPISRPYKTKRMRLIFNKGFLFYAEYNIRLLFLLLISKKSVLLSNDLDTLLPNYLVSKIQNKKLVYDSHELFTEVPELISRPKVQKIWLKIEEWIFPNLKNCYTVNYIIAKIYNDKYNVKVKVVRNIAPRLVSKSANFEFSNKIKGSKKMLILQGSGINVDRGAEEAVAMMQYLEGYILYIIGSGDIFDKLKDMVRELNLDSKIKIIDRIPYIELIEYTKIADLGLSLDKNTNLNYEYSLPNKVFDFIQTNTPMLVSNRKVVAQLVNKNNIGLVTDSHDPMKLAQLISDAFEDTNLYSQWQTNIKEAAKIYNWENESEKLKEIYSSLV